MKKALLTIGLAAAIGGSAAPAQAAPTDFCFYADSTPAKSEAPWKAIQCLQATGWWVNGYSGVKNIVWINSTASRWQETGWNLQPKVLVDWDSAREWGHAAGYGVYVNP